MKKLFQKDWFAIIFLGFVQGISMTLALEPFNFPLLGWIMPWPLFYFARRFRNSSAKLLLSGISCGFFFCVFTFYWMLHLFKNFAGLGPVMSALAFIPNAVFTNLQFPAFVLLFGITLRFRFRKFFYPRWFMAAFIALITDYFIPRVFPLVWGNYIAGNIIIVQVADLVGIHGLTFLLFAVSYFFYRIGAIFLKSFRESGLNGIFDTFMKIPMLKRVFPVPLLLIIILAYGFIRFDHFSDLQKELPKIRVAIVNPNAPPEDYDLVTSGVLGRLISSTIPGLVKKAAAASGGKMDLLVLPESGVPFLCGDDTSLNRKKGSYSSDFEKMALLIAYNYNADVFLSETIFKKIQTGPDRGRIKTYNSSVLYGRNGKRIDSYQKRRLLAFGEYMPGEKILKSLGIQKLVPGLGGFSRFAAGEESNLIPYAIKNRDKPFVNERPLRLWDLKEKSPGDFQKEFSSTRNFSEDGYFLPLICYEILFPDHVRSFFNGPQKRNPDFIVNITQDGWYGDTIETYQHYELARIRSVETRRALVRSVNDGAAGFVDIVGRYVRPLAGPVMTEAKTENFQVWDVPINREGPTVYVRFGDAWIILLVLVFFVSTGLKVVRFRNE